MAEVNNTFGEKHVYGLPATAASGSTFPLRFQAEKAFHVSPFNTMDGTCTFHFSDIRRELDIRIDLHRKGRHILTARLWGQPRPLSAVNHLKTLLRHPLRPHLTIPRIYMEAFMADEWDTDDIAAAIGFFIRNRDTLKDGDFKSPR